MVNKISHYLQDDKVYFVVIGIAHLLEDKGIIALLKNKGYTIEQL